MAQPTNLTLSQYQLDAARAKLIAYDEKFKDELGRAGPELDYARSYIYFPAANNIGVDRVRLPIPITSIELELWEGVHIFRENSTKFIELEKRPYHTGLRETVRAMAAFDWVGFNTAPAVIANVIKAWTSKNAIALLGTANTIVDYTGTNFFSSTVTKPENPLKDTSRLYKNYYTATPITQDNALAMIGNLADRRDFSDNSRGLMVTHAYSSTALFPLLMKVFKQERLANGESNPLLAYNIELLHWPDLPPTRWGIFAWRPDLPFFGALEDPPRTKVLAEGSYLYDQHDSFGFNAILDLGVGMLRPETIIGASTT